MKDLPDGWHAEIPQRRPICIAYNRGACSYGKACKFKHQCAICFGQNHAAQKCDPEKRK